MPDCLNQSIFVNILQHDHKEFKSIVKFNIEPSGGKGENFTCLVVRAKFVLELKDGSQTNTSYFVKLLPTNPSTRDMIASWKVIDKEKLSYTYHIPEFEALYRNVNKEITFGPKYYELNTMRNVTDPLIVLEDLSRRGFKHANRQQGFDLAHTEAVLKKLAQLHAASAVRYELKGPYSELYDRNLCSDVDKFKEFRDNQAKTLIACLPLYDAAYLESVLKTYTSVAPDQYQAYAPKFENEFRCLNHGDFYCNNIMFQYDKAGEIVDTYFIDLQMSRYCSPAQDLIYVLLSSVAYELKLHSFDYFISYYHIQLTDHLQLLKYPKNIPKLRDLHTAIYNHGDWVYPVISLLLPLILIDPTEKANTETLWDQEAAGDQLRKTMYGNPLVIQHFKKILPWAYNRGLFEYRE
ncbi:CG6908, partial [Drosophila busckii]